MDQQYTETSYNNILYDNQNDDNNNNNNNTQMYIINYGQNNLFILFIILLLIFSSINICKTINNHRIYRLNQINRMERLQRNQRNQLPNYTILQKYIIKIKEYKLNEDLEESDKCSICLENYKKNDIINVLKCGHKYHKNCIDDWINDNNNCPLCRLSL